jgi:hypothetical protein
MAGNSLLIVIGAVFGVFAVLFLYLTAKLWILTVLAVRRWTYRGVNVSGAWKGLGTSHVPASGEWSEVALRLTQDMGELHGRMMVRKRSTGQSFDLRLQVTGRIAEGHATLNLLPASKADASVATALLRIENGALTGQLLYRHPFAGTVDVIDVSVHRAESFAMPRLHPASRPGPAVQVAS